MAIDRDPNMPSTGSTIPPAGSTVPPQGSTMYDRDDMATTGTSMGYDRDLDSDRRGGSNFWAFLIGGLVIALGLMAFLFYDGGSTNRDVSTTGSTTPRVEAPARPTAPPATPNSPAAPAGTPAAPAR